MSEIRHEVPPEASVEKEIVDTPNTYKAIVGAAEGKKVVFTYNEHYGSFVTFEPDGKVRIENQDIPEYEHEIGNEGSSMDAFVTDMRRAIDLVKKAKIAVPVGNVERFGGMERIAQDIFDTSLIEGYIKSYEKMSPAKQEEYQKIMTDK